MNTFYPTSSVEYFTDKRIGIIGYIDTHPVTYSSVLDTIKCKSVMVPATNLISAYTSSNDKEEVDDGLVLDKDKYFFQIGCFLVSKTCAAELIKSLQQCRKSF